MLSFLRAKTLLSSAAPAQSIGYRLNRVVERIINSGKWKGTIGTMTLPIYYGHLALPQYCETLHGVKPTEPGNPPMSIGNQWLPFRASGVDPRQYSAATAQDLGERVVLREDTLATPAVLEIDDPGLSSVVIDGVTYEGNHTVPDFSGEIATIRKANETKHSLVTIRHGGVLISEIGRGQLSPVYRRYYLNEYSADPVKYLDCLVKRRHLELVDGDDVVIGNLSALENGLRALHYEIEDDFQRAGGYWSQCLKLLNDELGEYHAAIENPPIRVTRIGERGTHIPSLY